MTAGETAALKDWIAWPLVGPTAESLVGQLVDAFGRENCVYAGAWTAVRARITEDWLDESGSSHYVILGAGLDSYAWRHNTGITVIEVDHPASQQWKRERLAALQLEEPVNLVWEPCDFERQAVADVLRGIDFHDEQPFVSWIGVTPYLTKEAIADTLRSLPPCTLSVGYCLPEDEWSGPGEEPTRTFSTIAAESGESLVSAFSTDQFADLLAECGFEPIEDVGPEVSLEHFGHEAFSLGFERLALARKQN